MHVDDHRGRGARLGQLFDGDREAESVESSPAVLARHEDPEQPRFGRRCHRFVGETMLAVDLRGVGANDALREFTDRGAKAGVLGRKFEVQLRR